MRDDDLWITLAEMRLELSDEEAVEEWRNACDTIEDLVHVANRMGLGTGVAIMDARARAGIALEAGAGEGEASARAGIDRR